MPGYVPDNYDAWEEHQRREDKWLESLPKCSECGEAIQGDECYEFDDGLICEKCLKANYKVSTENYIRE